MSKGSSPPPAPDYKGAAVEQGAANVETARVQGRMSNPNVNTPMGSRTISYAGDQPTITDTLSAQGQQRFDQEGRIINQLGTTAEQGLGRVDQAMGQSLDTSGLPGMTGSVQQPDVQTSVTQQNPYGDFSADRRRVEDALMSRSNEEFDRRGEQVKNDMITRGFNPGSEAYQQEFKQLERGRNDANFNAMMAGGQEQSRLFGLGQQAGQFSNNAAAQQFNQGMQGGQFGNTARAQSLQEQLMQRQLPLNELNALRTGAPVNMPQFQQFNSPQPIQPPPLMGATQAQGNWDLGNYNANQAAGANTQAGLFGLGGAGMMALAMSDIRLKRNIERIGTHPRLGIGVYRYDIGDDHEVGVMAQELASVAPHAVAIGSDGFMRVNYNEVW